MAIENDVPTDEERKLAAETAHRAMIAGWEKAIQDVGRENGLQTLVIKNILNKVAKDSPNRDPSGRIDELQDYLHHQTRHNSDRVKGNLHKLSPGLKAYMEQKLQKK
jgi:hypothetical protein